MTSTHIKALHMTRTTQRVFDKYLSHGGLPGICFVRSDRVRKEMLMDILRLILDRDLRMVLKTTLSLETLLRYLRWISTQGFAPYNASIVKRTLGLAHPTQRALLYALESIFIIRRIPLLDRPGHIVLLEDQAEEFLLSEGSLSKSEQVLSAFYRNIRAQFLYRLGEAAQFESFLLTSGAHLPLVLRSPLGVLGFSVVEGDRPSLSMQRSADSFLKREPTGKVIFLVPKPISPVVVNKRTMMCSVASLL